MQYRRLHRNNTTFFFQKKSKIHASDKKSQSKLVQKDSNSTATSCKTGFKHITNTEYFIRCLAEFQHFSLSYTQGIS